VKGTSERPGGEARSGGHKRASILADALEALIGAVFLDGGFEPARDLVWRLFKDIDIAPGMAASGKDAKTELQEWLQARKLPVPNYRIAQTRGQAHAQTFEVECAVPALGLIDQGEGRSRRSAEQEAARRMLSKLKASDLPGGPLRS
jgi:ribonuclease-3